MDTNHEKLKILEILVEELLKDFPQDSIVEQCMSDAGIAASKDPIERINKVLTALHFEEPGKEFIE